MRNSVPPVRCAALALAAIAIIAVSTSPVRAGDIIADWAMAKTPPAPELKPVTVDVILDMMKGNCAARPRCLATVPAIKKLMDAARAADAMVSEPEAQRQQIWSTQESRRTRANGYFSGDLISSLAPA